MNWTIFIITVIVNALYCISLYMIQQKELKLGRISKRHSLIKGTNQRFLHWQDFASQTWGDFIFLPMISYSFIMQSPNLASSIMGMITVTLVFFCLAALIMIFMIMVCLHPSHKPDWGFPERGKISWGGATHTFYFGIYASMFLILLAPLIVGYIQGTDLYVFLTGCIGYAITWTTDGARGYFQPYTKIK